ncbi:MAG: multiheme c-type cytochrome [Planctomycetota bacterium]|jgi:hypothetical protein
MKLSLLLIPLLALPTLQADDDEGGAHVFQHSDSCARCHDRSPDAAALTRPDGSDGSPHGLWKGTMMAQSFLDPYWRAKVAREVEVNAATDGMERAEVEALCLRCHAPAAHHHDRLMGLPIRSVADVVGDAAALDGVTCTVCHRMTGEGLGEPSTFEGFPPHDLEARLYGPYPDPAAGPMRVHTGYEVTYGEHMVLSSVCATCHTQSSHFGGEAFPEQSPYLEWRNSVFSYEEEVTEDSRSCQQCHMEDQDELRIAHNPGGFDFGFVDERPEVRGHRFMGGNAFMLELMADHAEELGVLAPPEALRETAALTRRQLARRTARLRIEDESYDGEFLGFTVAVENLTGHKLPTGFPGRRMWIEVVVEGDRGVLWSSGTVGEDGRIEGLPDPLRARHRERVGPISRAPQVYELVALDPEGEPTVHLSRMASAGKDNRLLPRGWRPDGPHADRTAPAGIGDDPDFVGGSDRTFYAVPAPRQGAVLTVRARLLYQAVPPHWVDDLRTSEAGEAAAFVRLYDGRPLAPEVLASDQIVVGD